MVRDLDDAAALAPACAGAYGVFSIQNPDFADLTSDAERVRGRHLIDAARATGVTHFVQTTATGSGDYYRRSGWGARRGEINSPVSKGELEDRVRAAGFPYWTVLRPAFFMENLPYVLQGDRLVTAYAPDAPVPMVAVRDVGAAAAAAFREPDRFRYGRAGSRSGSVTAAVHSLGAASLRRARTARSFGRGGEDRDAR